MLSDGNGPDELETMTVTLYGRATLPTELCNAYAGASECGRRGMSHQKQVWKVSCLETWKNMT